MLLALVVVPTLGRLHQWEHAGAIEQVRAGQVGHATYAAQAGYSAAAGAQHVRHALRGEAAHSHGLHRPIHAQSQEPSQEPSQETAQEKVLKAARESVRESAHDHEDHGLLSLLLPSHAPVDCLLLDQLALADALYSAPLTLHAAVLAQAPPLQRAERAAAAHVALFQARGPPAA